MGCDLEHSKNTSAADEYLRLLEEDAQGDFCGEEESEVDQCFGGGVIKSVSPGGYMCLNMLDFCGMTLLCLVSERIVPPASVVVSGALALLLEKWWKRVVYRFLTHQ